MDAYVNVTGYVGADVELRDTARGHPCATFRIGTTPRIRRGSDWVDGETTWTTVLCYRGLASGVATSLRRGDAVIVIGKLRTQRWTGADRVEHERMVLEAATVGHDLSRGTSIFSRTERPPMATEDPLELAELILLAERKTELALAEPDGPADEPIEDDEQDDDLGAGPMGGERPVGDGPVEGGPGDGGPVSGRRARRRAGSVPA